MNTMTNHYKNILLYGLLSITLTIGNSIHAETIRNPMLFIGSVQFPFCLHQIPDVRIYCSGTKIICEKDDERKRISFSIAEDRNQTFFTILIAENITVATEFNTVKYFKVDANKPYAFYTLSLKEIVPEQEAHNRLQQSNYVWAIKKTELPFGGNRIPDNTIIVRYNPAFVDLLRGGNCVELPTIIIRPDILSLVGSEKMLDDKSIELLLSSLDCDTFHTHKKHEIKEYQATKTVLAVNV